MSEMRLHPSIQVRCGLHFCSVCFWKMTRVLEGRTQSGEGFPMDWGQNKWRNQLEALRSTEPFSYAPYVLRLCHLQDLNSAVRPVDTHYIATGEHADLWRGELVEPMKIKIFKSSEKRSVAIKVLRQRGTQSSHCCTKLEEVYFPSFPLVIKI